MATLSFVYEKIAQRFTVPRISLIVNFSKYPYIIHVLQITFSFQTSSNVLHSKPAVSFKRLDAQMLMEGYVTSLVPTATDWLAMQR